MRRVAPASILAIDRVLRDQVCASEEIGTDHVQRRTSFGTLIGGAFIHRGDQVRRREHLEKGETPVASGTALKADSLMKAKRKKVLQAPRQRQPARPECRRSHSWFGKLTPLEARRVLVS